MKRLTIIACACWLGLAGMSAAQSPLVASVAAPPPNSSDLLPATPSAAPTASPGEASMSREALAHEQHLQQSRASAALVFRAAAARAEQRTRRLEAQRWFGISNSRPTAAVDPIDGDYSPGWGSNDPFNPYRWVGNGAWGFVETR